MADKSSSAISVVGQFVDGLHVSVFGDPKWGALNRLKAVRNPRGRSELGIIPGVSGGPLMLNPRGKGRYLFSLENSDFQMDFSQARGLPEKMPRARIRFRARALYEHDLEEVEAIVEAVARYFLEPDSRIQVSRFDYAIDFQCREWRWPQREDFITRARSSKVHYQGSERITGMTFGDDMGAMQVVLYDKSHEIKVHHKEWMTDLYAPRETYDDRLPVYRLEFRFRRPALRQMRGDKFISGLSGGIDSISDLGASIGDLLRHVVGGDGKKPWFRVASPESRGCRTDRRSDASWWKELSKTMLEGRPETGRIRHRSTPSSSSIKHCSRTFAAYALKCAAQARISTPEQLCECFLNEWLPDWLEAKGFSSFEEAVVSKERENGSGGVVASL